MVEEALFRGLAAFAIAAILLWLLEPVGIRIGLLDYPGGRKDHGQPTPLVGGIAMSLAFAFVVLTPDFPLSHYRALFVGALLIVFAGVLDDLRARSTRVRFVAQIGAGFTMTLWGGVVLRDLGHIGPGGALVDLGVFSVPLTVFAVVGVSNAVNMSDGIDGLAGSLCLITVVSLGALAWTDGNVPFLNMVALLGAVILAFLLSNFRCHDRALVFMGDAGSMFLGFVLAWLLVQFSQGEERLMEPVTALWIIALPLIDTVSMMVRRVLRRRSPFEADREHFHYVLRAAGFSQNQTLGIMVAFSAAAAGVGLAAHFLGVSSHWMLLAFLGLFGLHFWTIMRAWRFKRFFSRPMFGTAEDARGASHAISDPYRDIAGSGRC